MTQSTDNGSRTPCARLLVGPLGLLLALVAASCDPGGDLVILPQGIVIDVGESVELSAVRSPSEQTVQRVAWSTENSATAAVTEDGTLTGVAPGVTRVRGVARSDGTVARVSVTVEEGYEDGTLLISEVGASPFESVPGWIEIYNPGSTEVDLSSYTLRTTARDTQNTHDYFPDVSFPLPSRTLMPGSYALLVGHYDPNDVTTNSHVLVRDAQGRAPNWTHERGGFVELQAGGSTIDFVRFGVVETEPLDVGEWHGAGAPDLPDWNDLYYSYSIARKPGMVDSDSAEDWRVRSFSSPGGPNDVTDTHDGDQDGIPDANEAPGTTFAGLPLYKWGARPDQPDIFIHINYMTGYPALIPRKTGLDELVEIFAREGIGLHIDVGDLFHDAPGIAPAQYDLSDDSNEIPFEGCTSLGGTDPETGCTGSLEYKYEHMPIARKQIFHYAVIANSEVPDGSGDFTGRGEYGNDLILWMDSVSDVFDEGSDDAQRIAKRQGSLIMHELGHNLGLGHGGFERLNYKPNYVSIMNYLYGSRGLPEIGHPQEGDRYYLEYGFLGYERRSDLHRPKFRPFDDGILDYSHGEADPIDESAVDESRGLYHPGSAPVDYNGDGDTNDVLTNFNVNSSYDPNVEAADEEIGILKDHDDWANLQIFFARDFAAGVRDSYMRDTGAGDRELPRHRGLDHFHWHDPVGDDIQPSVGCRVPIPGIEW